MKVGYKTEQENNFNHLSLENDSSEPVVLSVSQEKKSDINQKYIVWHIEGGLGKNVAATALVSSLVKKHQDRKLVIVASYPEIFLNHPEVYRVYRVGLTPYFYDDYILGKDTIVFRQEPYFQSEHIMRKKNLIENWADILGITFNNQHPKIFMNMVQSQTGGIWERSKPVLLIQTAGGPLQGQKLNYSWTRDMPIDLALHISQIYSEKYHIIQLTREGAIKLPNVEVVDYPMTNMELVSLIIMSHRRVLIDSSGQHIAAAFNLKSLVFWIGTSKENFGYDLHLNVNSLPPKRQTKMIDSYLFDYSFEGNFHECPYQNVNEMFDIFDVEKKINEYLN